MIKQSVDILVVEDSNSVIETYQEMASSYSRHSEKYNINIDSVTTLEDAISKLESLENIYIGAVVDLDLTHTNGADRSGTEVVEFIKNNLRLPVYIISSTTYNLGAEDFDRNDLYKVYDRDNDDYDFIDDFIKIHSTGITDILNRTGTIEEFINTIYWKHLSTSLSPWIEDKIRSEDDKKQSLIRYCIMHLQEYLEMNTGGEGFSEYFPAEFFITGPIKPSLFTGDIIEYESKFFVVVTPACDLGNNKAERISCLEVKALKDVDERFDISSKSNNVKGTIKKYLTNKNDRYHFIPSLYFKGREYNAGLLDFQNQRSFDFEEITQNSVRIATISQPFLKDLVSRYSRYFSRQGAPNISIQQLKSAYLK